MTGMPKRAREPLKPLHIPLDFDEAVKALLGTPPPPKDTPGTRTVKKAAVHKEIPYRTRGYVVRTEDWRVGNAPPVRVRSAYSILDGSYIGDPKTARRLSNRGILPQRRLPSHQVATIGYSPRDGKWYGWSHRAIAGFKPGDIVRKGQILAGTYSPGTVARTMDEAKEFASVFAESVS
jgi:hypothetical protein